MPRVKNLLFNQNFEVTQRDLLYGKSQGGTVWRDLYISTLPQGLQYMNDNFFWSIDSYNNNLALFSPTDNFDDIEQRMLEDRPGVATVPKPIDNYQSIYYSSIMSSKYTPKRVFGNNREVESKLRREGYHAMRDVFDEQQALALSRQYLMVRRACKFGILHFAQMSRSRVWGTEPIIHFALDGLNMQEVVNNAKVTGHVGREAVPITYSELRNCYRHWDEIREYVWFYKNYQSVAPPWVQDQTLWQNYAAARATKMTRLFRRVQRALTMYRIGYVIHWGRKRETKYVMDQLDQILAMPHHEDTYKLLKQTCRWYLGFSSQPPVHGSLKFAEPLDADSRFREKLEEHYMNWSNGE